MEMRPKLIKKKKKEKEIEQEQEKRHLDEHPLTIFLQKLVLFKHQNISEPHQQ